MFKLKNDSQAFSAQPNLYCVWIRADERPNAPLVSVCIDRQMTAFETSREEHPAAFSSEPVPASDPDHPASFGFALELAPAAVVAG
jgi:hypothetical protein